MLGADPSEGTPAPSQSYRVSRVVGGCDPRKIPPRWSPLGQEARERNFQNGSWSLGSGPQEGGDGSPWKVLICVSQLSQCQEAETGLTSLLPQMLGDVYGAPLLLQGARMSRRQAWGRKPLLWTVGQLGAPWWPQGRASVRCGLPVALVSWQGLHDRAGLGCWDSTSATSHHGGGLGLALSFPWHPSPSWGPC